MRKPRTNILWVTMVFVIVGLVGQAWLAGKSADATSAVPNRHVVSSSAAPAPNPGLARPRNSDLPLGIQELGVSMPVMLPQEISADASVLVIEMCELQLLAQGTELSLNSGQWPGFAAVVLRCQAIRHAFEAQIAHPRKIAPGLYRVEIPTYTEWGGELRERFSTELCAELGETTALEVMAKLGDRLEKHFAGFGISAQTLDITVNPSGEPNDIRIARTTNSWNRIDGSDRLTTRTEIHFPVLEDPSGDSWSAMLTKVGESTDADNGSG